MFAHDLGQPKASSLARNVLPHMIDGGSIDVIDEPFDDETAPSLAVPDVALFLVDNNRCRLEGVQYARRHRIPVVFSMLSADSMRIHTFLQGADAGAACLWCALPNLDPDRAAPCAVSIITSCLASAASSVFFVHRAMMGWPEGSQAFNWREDDLMGCRSWRRLPVNNPRTASCARPAIQF
jgi:hypothetical protein